MGRELRCFFPISLLSTSTKPPPSPSSLVTLYSLAFSVDTLFSSPLAEHRPDDYINLRNVEFGLKFRGGKQLELKTRTATERGGVEKWSKSVMSVSNKSLKGVLEALTKANRKAQLPTTEADFQSSIIRVSKSRIQQSSGHVIWEVADLELSFPSSSSSSSSSLSSSSSSSSPSSPPLLWRSVCFEEGTSQDLAKLMGDFETQFRLRFPFFSSSATSPTLLMMGYPEFLASLTP